MRLPLRVIGLLCVAVLLAPVAAAGTQEGSSAPEETAGSGTGAGSAASEGPLARLAAAGRAALTAAGLERLEVEAAGRRLVVWRGGSGPDLILLHGSGQQAGSWAAVVPGLVEGYSLHVLDLPGHGDSEPVDGVLPMGTIVAGVEAYLLSLDASPDGGTGKAILVGNSLGAWLATLQAHRHPERVARAVLVNGGALLNVPPEGLTLVPADREEARRVMAAVRDPASPPLSDELLDDLVHHSRDGPTARMLDDPIGLTAHLLDGKLGEVEVPVDALWGASDGLIPLDYARRMTDQLPRARLTVIEGCGHVPPTECPERFLEALRGVLAQPPPSPRAKESAPATEESPAEREEWT